MKPPEIPLSSAWYVGHVKNGVVVLDTPVCLTEGQTVRVEPLGEKMETQTDIEPTDRVQQLRQLFAEWIEEDGKLSDEEADRLHTALEHS